MTKGKTICSVLKTIRRQLGKAVAVVGLSAGLFTLTGCTSKVKDPNAGKDQQQIVVDSDSIRRMEQVDGMLELDDDVAVVDADSATEKCSN